VSNNLIEVESDSVIDLLAQFASPKASFMDTLCKKNIINVYCAFSPTSVPTNTHILQRMP
jgi:hypothetical protein